MTERIDIIRDAMRAAQPPVLGVPPYGCHNRAPLSDQAIQKPGYAIVTVSMRFNPDCQYTRSELGRQDARCVGCRWRAED